MFQIWFFIESIRKKAYNLCLWLIRLWGKNESWLLGKIISPAASSILWYISLFWFFFPPLPSKDIHLGLRTSILC